MPILRRQIIIEVEAKAFAVNNHEQGGELERRFIEEQLAEPIERALSAFHRAHLGDVTFRADVQPL